ncbi:unnamed protein product [Oppiella nova]|uniref:Heat shock protein 70 n=1 Tax=Oppiella nova TaxID=334625 RepID=A0A7R9QBX6_9ACAR|nr:unnamed protein product [Oppiella nova]CAG2162846.1 unnamed protein product [Oppiella nova]
MAGLNVLKIINEPTAAALAYQLDRFDDIQARKVLIYDFGGGTFDVAILKLQMGQIEVCAVGGDNHLGGDNLDNNVIEHCLKEFYSRKGILIDRTSAEGERALRLLRTQCKREKWLLSEAMSATIAVDNIIAGQHLVVELTRGKFEELNEHLFIRTMQCVDRVLIDAGMSVDDVDDVVLVGGSTHIPFVKNLIEDRFGGKLSTRLDTEKVDPLQAVAKGAAIQVAILNGNQAQKHRTLRVLNVTPHTLGVRTAGDVMSPVIRAQSRVCTPFTKIYRTVCDYQTDIDVEVYEGEDAVATRNDLLGRFTVTNIPAEEAGRQNISVMFCVNDEGTLKVRAEVLSMGTAHEIEVTEYKGRLSMDELLKRRH